MIKCCYYQLSFIQSGLDYFQKYYRSDKGEEEFIYHGYKIGSKKDDKYPLEDFLSQLGCYITKNNQGLALLKKKCEPPVQQVVEPEDENKHSSTSSLDYFSCS